VEQPDVEQMVVLWIDCGIQPELFVVYLDHSLIYRHVIQASTVVGL